MILIDGKKNSAEIKEEIKTRVAEIKAEGGKIPHLVAILVGYDGASQTTWELKVKPAEYVWFESTLVKIGRDVTEWNCFER